MTEFTAHFRLPIPDFNQEPWHDQFRDLCFAIDTMAFEALLANASAWANDTPYVVGQIVLDDTNGLLYVCAIAHTSPPFPTTFLTFRNTNPTYWNAALQIPQQRGAWTTATAYVAGDFVVNGVQYAVCLVSHVSTVFNDDVGDGFWSILIDLTGVSDVGINGLPETTVAAAPTTNLGAANPTMVLVSGGGQTITSFGSSINLFKIIRFDGANTLTHNATTLILLSGENRTTIANDVMFLRSDAAGNWRELYYYARASESSKGVIELATAGEAQAGTNTLHAMTPIRTKEQWSFNFNAYFPPGVTILMQQTTPPAGWTKSLVHNDKALRVVTGAAGSGGVSAFSTIFGKLATDQHTLDTSQMPSHSHTMNDPQHDHGITATNFDGTVIGISAGAGGSTFWSWPGSNGSAVGVDPAPSSTNISINNTGAGFGHSHGMDIRVQFVDVIIAVRNA